MVYIKIKKGKLKRAVLTGDTATNLTELVALIDQLKEKGVKKSQIEDVVELGLADKEDKPKVMMKQMDRLFEKLIKNLEGNPEFNLKDLKED